MSLSIPELRKRYSEWGLKLVPLRDSHSVKDYNEKKHPKTKNGKWKDVDWSEQELDSAERLGIMHNESNAVDVDFDDPVASQFIDMLPDTLTVGKMINGSGTAIPTHKLYIVDEGIERREESYPTSAPKGKKVIELLVNKQSWYIGEREQINLIEPKRLNAAEYQELKKIIKKIYALTYLTKKYPRKGIGFRDNFIFAVAGTIVRVTDWSTTEREEFIRRLAAAAGDVDELKNRIDKIKYHEKNLEDPEKANLIPNAQSLCEILGVDQKKGIDCIDVIKAPNVDIREDFKENVEPEDVGMIVGLSLRKFLAKDYPPNNYLQYPIVMRPSITQIWGHEGAGKSLISIYMSCCIVNGVPFLHYEFEKGTVPEPWPVVYVEAEMPNTQVQDRFNKVAERYEEINGQGSFNLDYLHVCPSGEQPNKQFESISGESNRGRKRIENFLESVYKKTGKKPFVFLDSITFLSDIQEKDGQEWNPIMQWIVKLRNKGYGIIFLHHSTKEGSTSSGSNVKERPIDLSIQIKKPKDDELLTAYDREKFTQLKVVFHKWREHCFTKWDKPFIATLSRDTCDWKSHAFMPKDQRLVKDLIDQGKGKNTIKKELVDEGIMGKTKFYEIWKKIGGDKK
jgi:Fe-S cluster biosynthesis and repair protein YggX